MPFLAATRSSQDLLAAEFNFSFDDTARDSVSLTTKTFGSVFTDAIVFDGINLPVDGGRTGGL